MLCCTYGPEAIYLQSRMRLQQFAFAGTTSKFAKHVLYRDSRSLEHRFSHHDAGLLFNVVLPISAMIVLRPAGNAGFD